VQSADKPDWNYAFQNACYLLAASPQVKPFEPDFEKGQSLRFRLLANPTRKIDTKSGPDGRRRNGKRVAVSPDKFYEWLAQRAEPAGFRVNEDSTTVQPGYAYFKKEQNGEPRRLRSVRYDGMLRIANPERFKEALASGIGSAKAFGFGLLSIAKA
jgi:CRISPR system Cascade subunit CasE